MWWLITVIDARTGQYYHFVGNKCPAIASIRLVEETGLAVKNSMLIHSEEVSEEFKEEWEELKQPVHEWD